MGSFCAFSITKNKISKITKIPFTPTEESTIKTESPHDKIKTQTHPSDFLMYNQVNIKNYTSFDELISKSLDLKPTYLKLEQT